MRPHTTLVLGVLSLGLTGCVLYQEPDDGEPPRPVAPPGTDTAPGESEPGELVDPPVRDVVRVCANERFTTISAALRVIAPGGVVKVCPGYYPERLRITQAVTIESTFPAGDIVIDGGGEGPTVLVDRAGGLVTIGSVVITGGVAARGGGVSCIDSPLRMYLAVLRENVADEDGGGLHAAGCDVDLSSVTFTGNLAGGYGGGAVFRDGTLGTLRNATFTDNQAAAAGGAAFLSQVDVHHSLVEDNTASELGGGLVFYAPSFVDRTTITGNAAPTGGGIWVSAAVHVADSEIADNRADRGGGVYVTGFAPHLSSTIISGNHATRDGGGALVEGGTPTLHGVRFERNTAGTDGGGLRVHRGGGSYDALIMRDNVAGDEGGGLDLVDTAVAIVDSDIGGNQARRGGGLRVVGVPAPGFSLSTTRVANNVAELDGGGILLDPSDPGHPVRLWGVYVGHNDAMDGGGIAALRSPLELRNSAVVTNHALGGGAIWIGPTGDGEAPRAVDILFTTFHHNLALRGAALLVDTPLLTIRGSILADNGLDPQVVVRAHGTTPWITWQYNDTFPAGFAGMDDPTGVDGNLAAPPRFRSTPNGNYRLAEGSPCIDAGPPMFLDAGGTRSDMGMWGGPQIVSLP